MKNLILIIALLLTACGGGGGGSEEPKETSSEVIIEIADKQQDFAFDEVNNLLYTLNDGLLSTYKNGYLESQKDTNMGHQGLSVQYGVGLWSSSAINRSDAVINEATHKLFGDEFIGSVSCTPAISKDQRYLIAFGIKGDITYIRVWDIDTKPTPDNFLHEINAGEIIKKPHYGQGLASDGLHIYLVTGNKSSENRLYKWTIEGEFIGKKILPYKEEPEGLDFHNGELVIGIWSESFKLIDLGYLSTQST